MSDKRVTIYQKNNEQKNFYTTQIINYFTTNALVLDEKENKFIWTDQGRFYLIGLKNNNKNPQIEIQQMHSCKIPKNLEIKLKEEGFEILK